MNQGTSAKEKDLCLIIEDQVKVAESLRHLVETRFPSLNVITFRDFRETAEFLHLRQQLSVKAPIQLALVDIGLPDGSGIELLRQIAVQEPTARAVVITIYDDENYLFEALKAGAYGYILKDDDPQALGLLLDRIEKNEPPLSPPIARKLLAYFQNLGQPSEKAAEDCSLSPRERETLVLLSHGMTVASAAQHMGLSRQTVAGYVKIVYQKLHVSNRAEAVREALRRGIV